MITYSSSSVSENASQTALITIIFISVCNVITMGRERRHRQTVPVPRNIIIIVRFNITILINGPSRRRSSRRQRTRTETNAPSIFLSHFILIPLPRRPSSSRYPPPRLVPPTTSTAPLSFENEIVLTSLYHLIIYTFVHILFEAIVDFMTVDVVTGRESVGGGFFFSYLLQGFDIFSSLKTLIALVQKKVPTDEDVDFC